MTIDEAYLILGIENRNISMDELRRIYYQAAHLSHPDNNPQNHYAQSKFAMIQEAYLILKGEIKAGKMIKEEYRQQTNQQGRKIAGIIIMMQIVNIARCAMKNLNEIFMRLLKRIAERHRLCIQNKKNRQQQPRHSFNHLTRWPRMSLITGDCFWVQM